MNKPMKKFGMKHYTNDLMKNSRLKRCNDENDIESMITHKRFRCW